MLFHCRVPLACNQTNECTQVLPERHSTLPQPRIPCRLVLCVVFIIGFSLRWDIPFAAPFCHCASFRFLMMRNLSLIFSILFYVLSCVANTSLHLLCYVRPKMPAELKPCLAALSPLIGPLWCLPLCRPTFWEDETSLVLCL